MNEKILNQEINRIRNGLHSYDSHFVQYQSFDEEFKHPCYMVNLQKLPLCAFVCVMKTNESLLVSGLVNETKIDSNPESTDMRLTVQSLPHLKCKALVENNRNPVCVLGNQDSDLSNGVNQLFFYAHTNYNQFAFTHMVIFDSTINKTPLNLVSQDMDIRLHMVQEFLKHIKPYENYIDVNLFIQEATLVNNESK